MFLFKKQKSNDLEYNLNEQCLVCKHILENNEQILYIKRNKDDGKYQFLCDAEKIHSDADIKIVELKDVIKINEAIKDMLPLEPGIELRWKFVKGKGLELKKFIQDGINSIIQQDIKDNKVSMSQLYNNGEIVYYNGRNGTWFDWDINGKSSWFTVCFNDKKRMGYISIAILKDGAVEGYKWGNYGKDEAESISIGHLNDEDKEYLLRLLLQQADDKGIFDVSIEDINWETPIFLESLEDEENKK